MALSPRVASLGEHRDLVRLASRAMHSLWRAPDVDMALDGRTILTPEGVTRLVCPACKGPDGLWASATFEGWHSIDVTFDGTRARMEKARRGTPYYEITWSEPLELDPYDVGCSCGWTGHKADLVQLGLDGEPLPRIHPSQGALC